MLETEFVDDPEIVPELLEDIVVLSLNEDVEDGETDELIVLEEDGEIEFVGDDEYDDVTEELSEELTETVVVCVVEDEIVLVSVGLVLLDTEVE